MNDLNIKKIRPGIIIIFATVLASLLIASALFEIKSSNQEMMAVLREQAAVLMSSLIKGSTNAIFASENLEKETGERLLANARYIENLDHRKILDENLLTQIAQTNGIQEIQIYDPNGNIGFSFENDENIASPQLEYHKFVKPFLSGKNDEEIVGILDDPVLLENKFTVLKRRRVGGAILISINADQMMSFQKETGVGRLIQNIAKNEGIEYVILQDELGIIIASENVVSIPSIQNDDFLQTALQNIEQKSRIYHFAQKQVFEIVEPFKIENDINGLYRIGLSMKYIQDMNHRSIFRVVLASLVFLILGLVVFNFTLTNQNYSLIREAYRRIQTYTGNILHNMADGVVAINDKHTITVFNRAAENLFNIPAAKAIGYRSTKISGLISDLLQKTLENKKPEPERVYDANIKGQKKVFSISTSILFDQKGKADTAFVLIRDLTEQRELEEQARRKDKLTAMGELASGVAHEIRNPLNAIAVISQRFGKEFKPEEDEAEYHKLLRIVSNEVSRINAIIGQFLQYARPPRLDLAKADLCQVVERVATLFDREIKSKGIEFKLKLQKVPAILIDSNQIMQALQNIVNNAIQATEGGGEITIECDSNNSHAVITISDTGRGIPENDLQKIFNLYYTTKESGTGLGLSIVHQIISQHDGKITVQSKKGEGSSFMIYLPLKQDSLNSA